MARGEQQAWTEPGQGSMTQRWQAARGYYGRQATAVYELEMREATIRLTREGLTHKEIAARLGVTPHQVARWKRQAVEASARRAAAERNDWPPEAITGRSTPAPIPLAPPQGPRSYRPAYFPPEPEKGPTPGTVRDHARFGRDPAHPPPYEVPRWADPRFATGGARSATDGATFETSSSPPPPSSSSPSIDGELLDPPDVVILKRQCLELRKAMIPFAQMAEMLGITAQQARDYTAGALGDLERSESLNADQERTLMLQQLDQMIQAVIPMATGYSVEYGKVPLDLGGMDRYMKLLKQKADLLGINQVPAVDIRIKLQRFADEHGYAIEDVEDIARDVLASHKLKLPEFR